MIHAIHYWMIYYTVIKHPFLDDSCHPLLDDLLHCYQTSIFGWFMPIHYWMIYYTVIKHPFLDDSCHPLLDDLLHCNQTSIFGWFMPSIIGWFITLASYNGCLCRFVVPPTIITYDNGCKLHQYALNREPRHFRDTTFLVDRFHWRGHTGCSVATHWIATPP